MPAHPDGRLSSLAEAARNGRLTPVDPWDLAASWNVEVVERRLLSTMLGARMPSGRIVLSDALSSERKRLVLAHELGHVLVASGSALWVAPRYEETFCDHFAWELLAPLEELSDQDLAAGAGERFGVEDSVVLSQLTMAGIEGPQLRASAA